MFTGTYIVFNKNKYNNGNISKETIFKNQERNKGRKGRRKEKREKEGRKKEDEKQTNRETKKKERTRHLYLNFIASSLLLEYTHIQNMNLVS